MTHRDTALTVKEPVWNENSTWSESNGHKRSCALIGSHILENKEILFIPRKGNSNQKSAPNFWQISTYLKWANMDLHSNAFISSVFIFSFNFSFLSFTLLFVCSPFLPFESIQSLSDIVNTCFSMLDLVYMVFYFDATPFLLISCFFLFCSRVCENAILSPYKSTFCGFIHSSLVRLFMTFHVKLCDKIVFDYCVVWRCSYKIDSAAAG